jgi:alkyl hydroperoxide reductase subunit AhpC
MAIRLGDEAPDFSCTTELGAVAALKPEFDRRTPR